MDQKQLIVAAMQQEGLTSYYQLAQRLGVTDARVSHLRHGRQTADEAEISMLAEMAKIDVRVALAAVHKDREKNPAKRAYWEKISMQFAMAMMLIALGFTGFSEEAKATEAKSPDYKLCECLGGQKAVISQQRGVFFRRKALL